MAADISLEKGLPHNLDAERCVLGAIILDNSLIDQAVEIIRPEDFYLTNHRLLFDQMLALSEKSKGIDLVTLSEMLNQAGQLENLGGASFISSLVDGVLITRSNFLCSR